MRILLNLTVVVVLAAACIGQDAQDNVQKSAQGKIPKDLPAYRNPFLPIPDRVADLLSRMTLEEKVDQLAGGRRRMMTIQDPEGQAIFLKFRALFGNDSQVSAHDAAELRNQAQKYMIEKTRLGHSHAVHGRSACTATWLMAAPVFRKS